MSSIFILFSYCIYSQDVDEEYLKQVTVKEWNCSLFINTSGFGVGFQNGRTPNHFNKHFWEIDLLYSRHSKEVRARNTYYQDATTYCYGKLYQLFFLRAGYGYQRTIHHKPYWGGVQIRYSISGGFSMAMGIPVYLKVIKYDPTGINAYTDIERYDPEVHTIDNILGSAGFFQGILHTAFRPGFYAKTGLVFDFSKKETSIQAIEVGASIDMVFPFIQQMAFNNPKPFYLCAYISYNFGKKKGIYD